MRILILSNYYPPYVQGGYELRCSETAAELVKRGHTVCVLTTCDNDRLIKRNVEGVEVWYGLHLEVDPRPLRTPIRFFFHRTRYQKENCQLVENAIAEFCPDVVFIWGMWNVPRDVPATVERLCPGRVVYHISDYWPSLPSAYRQYWEKPSGRRLTVLPKKLIARIALARLAQTEEPSLRFEYPTCVSRALKDNLVAAGAPIAHAAVLHSGVDVRRFKPSDSFPNNRGGPLRLVYAGRLTADKGVHTAIEAMACLVQHQGINVSLDIIGAGDESYAAMLKTLASSGSKPLPIRFLGKSGKPQMPDLLAEYDILVFPSIWPEPFAGVVIEAMATGLVVVGTPNGGTSEILVDGETGLLFPPGDAEALANAIARLAADHNLLMRLSKNGRETVLRNFTRDAMVNRFENYLHFVVSRAQSPLDTTLQP